ncbi:MAG TPA: ABC transporter permease [Chloroflexota bacterium]|nr:ABC transporter permease [Chloroflexota bacterium]
MRTYTLSRLLAAVPTIVGITVLIFLAMRVLPGDPVAMIVSEGQGTHRLTEEELRRARASLGLDRPLYVQYLSWMSDVLRGEMGVSFWRGEPIRDIIARRGPITAQIALMAICLSWLIGIPIGLFSALRRNTFWELVARVGVTVFMAVPSFWIGLMVVLMGVLLFTWRPPLTIVYVWDDPGLNLQMTIGPALALGIGLGAVTARMARSSALEVLHDDYVRTARAKGLRERVVIWRHVFRNALLPVITLSGLALGGLLGGSVAVERAFGVPGLGLALVQALSERDWTMIQNMVLLYGLIFTAINLLVDLSYGWLDPRIRYQ